MPKGNSLSAEALDQMRRWQQAGLPNVIFFYSQRKLPQGVFSNFFAAPIVIKGTRFSTSEHFFQAMKFVHSKNDFDDAVAAISPGDTAAVGRDRSRPLRHDWESVKNSIMFDAITAKFLQDSDLMQLLLATGTTTALVESTERDTYWAQGGTGLGFALNDPKSKGHNWLGALLMKLRSALLEHVVPNPALRAVIAEKIREEGINALRGNADMLALPLSACAPSAISSLPSPTSGASSAAAAQAAATATPSLPSPQQQQQQPSSKASAAASAKPQQQRDHEPKSESKSGGNLNDDDDDDDDEQPTAASSAVKKKRRGRLQQ